MFADVGEEFMPCVVRCLLKGTVLAYQNEVLLIGEPVHWDGKKLDMEVYDKKQWNCWFVHFLYGPGLTTKGVGKLMPFFLEYTAFARRSRGQGIKVLKTARLI
jgi:hypothetical protein